MVHLGLRPFVNMAPMWENFLENITPLVFVECSTMCWFKILELKATELYEVASVYIFHQSNGYLNGL